MTESKRRADLLIIHGLLVTVDAKMRVLTDSALAVQGTNIVAVGSTAELQTQFDAPVIFDATDQIVMPGLVNAHTHTPAVIFRGLTEDLRLEPWLSKSWRFEAEFITPENVRTGALLAQAEMIRSGTTTALDMFYFPEVSAQVAQGSGFRLMTGPLYMDFPGIPDHIPDRERTARGREFLQEYKNDPLITTCVQPHSTYTVPRHLLTEAKQLADEFGVLLNTHCSETAVEVATVKSKTGMSPPRYLDQLGLLSEHSVLAHGVHVPEDEIDLIAARQSAVAHCPLSNLKLACGIAPIAKMKSKGIKLGFGTDSAQSSNDLNLWNALRVGALLQKNALGDPTVMAAPDIVRMATYGAGQALGLDDKIGSLEVGKRADLILLDLGMEHTMPLYDVYAQLVYAIGRDNVASVIINGRPVLHQRKLLTIHESDLAAKVSALAQRVNTFANG